MERHLATVFILHLMQRNPLATHLHMVLTGNMEMRQKVIWQCSKSQPETFMMYTVKAMAMRLTIIRISMRTIRIRTAAGLTAGAYMETVIFATTR